MSDNLDPKIREFLAGIGRKGGRNRAKSHTADELSAWAKRGGHPTVLTEKKLKQIARLRGQGETLEVISKKVGVSVATVQRAVARMEKTGVDNGQGTE